MSLKEYIIALSAVAFVACGDPIDVPAQRDSISKYLNSKNIKVDSVGGVYVYVVNAARAGRDAAPETERGDLVSFFFTAYTFSASFDPLITPDKATDIYLSNRPEVITAQSLDDVPLAWPVGPEQVRLGQTDLIKGLEAGLTGFKEGDSLHIFIPSDKGYGDKPMGAVPKGSPLVFVTNITEVKKNN